MLHVLSVPCDWRLRTWDRTSEGAALDEYPPGEVNDLCEVIEWLAGQTSCTGAVRMFGGFAMLSPKPRANELNSWLTPQGSPLTQLTEDAQHHVRTERHLWLRR